VSPERLPSRHVMPVGQRHARVVLSLPPPGAGPAAGGRQTYDRRETAVADSRRADKLGGHAARKREPSFFWWPPSMQRYNPIYRTPPARPCRDSEFWEHSRYGSFENYASDENPYPAETQLVFGDAAKSGTAFSSEHGSPLPSICLRRLAWAGRVDAAWVSGSPKPRDRDRKSSYGHPSATRGVNPFVTVLTRLSPNRRDGPTRTTAGIREGVP